MTAPVFHMLASAPTPVAPFSHAAEVDGWVFVTGQMPTDPNDDARPLPEGIEAQTRRVMDNRVLQVLHNLRYVGAFIFGRLRARRDIGGRSHIHRLPQDQW